MTGSGGLSAGEVRLSRQQHGANSLEKQAGSSLLSRFLEGFADPIIRILLIALAINVIFMLRGAPWFETAGIAIAVFLATFVSALSEYGSDAAFRRMQAEAAAVTCRVRRDGGQLYTIPADDIVCGDLVLLQAGERIPADGFLREGSLEVDQSALTGESHEIRKRPQAENSAADQTGLLFRGSVVVSGEGMMEVTAVGSKTMYGSMARQMQEDTRESPLHVRLEALASTISRLGMGAAILVAASDLSLSLFVQGGLMQGPAAIFQHILHAVTLAVTVLVVAVPEGLPMMITVVLSSNMVRMLRDHVLVRRLTGIETAGSMNILFTDKTGTLTCGRMTADMVFAGDGTRFDGIPAVRAGAPALYSRIFADCRCNTGAALSAGTVSGGNTTDRALLRAVLSMAAVEPPEQVGDKVPFDSRRKYAAVRLPARALTLVRGAPEILLPRCAQYLSPDGRVHSLSRDIPLRILREQAAEGGRVIAMAATDRTVTADHIPSGLTLTALIVLRDPVRPETPEAVCQLHTAGIRTVMLTGDHPDTAKAVARRCGLLASDTDLVIDSAQLAAWSDAELTQRLPQLAVIARAMPADKVRLVQAAQRAGMVAGMTGDGVNDAPALKAADIGCAMGITGTDVAKGAADMTLTDDNFATIVEAVREGRGIYANIRKVVGFLLGTNIGEVLLVFAAMLLWHKSPLISMQLLWINLVTDSLPAIALGMEAVEPDVMDQQPKRKKEGLFAHGLGIRTVLQGFMFGLLSLLAYWLGERQAGTAAGGQAMAFMVLALTQIVQAFNMRSEHSLFTIGPFTNPALNKAALTSTALVALVLFTPLHTAFGLTLLPWKLYLQALGLILVPLPVMELSKAFGLIKHQH